MDPKRPDVRLDESPDEEGIVTKRKRGEDAGPVRAVVGKLERVADALKRDQER